MSDSSFLVSASAPSIAERLAKVRQAIHSAEILYHRRPSSVQLLAVSKHQSVEKINEAVAAGQLEFAESYSQEALLKIAALKNYPIEWHFIGGIQANKTRGIAENFSWVHSLSSVKIAQRLNDQRPKTLAPLNICIQVNIKQKASKPGVYPQELLAFIEPIRNLKQLRIRGLMTLLPANLNEQELQLCFRQLYQLYHKILPQCELDTLSMGMSQDFVATIAQGSTCVRIGTAIFGPRK